MQQIFVFGTRGKGRWAMRNIGIRPTDPLGWVVTFAELGTLGPRLLVRNHRSVDPIVGTGAANVSLTSYGKRIATVWLLAVVEDDDVGVIGVDDDALMRTPRSTVASGAFVISVTGSSSR